MAPSDTRGARDAYIMFGMLAFILLTFCILGGFVGVGNIWAAVTFLLWTLAFTAAVGFAVWQWRPK